MSTASPTSSAPAGATTTSSSSGGSGPTSSPLLFFVALGFGVVFTNLWIIVGVKYCFRYNQRNRQARQDENGEPIDLTAMPRPHRRRREKKLMSMDEVNERFPLLKYKSWRAARESKGLSTAGGVTAPPSRAASVKDVDVGTRSSEEHDPPASPPSQSERPSSPRELSTSEGGPSAAQETNSSEIVTTEKSPVLPQLEQMNTTSSEFMETPKHAHSSGEDDDDEEDHIHDAVPAELLPNPGDACAICLETLEDDDDVRGLTCGHAFHAGCLDPWLTSRRACCPLCKADYYVPKPRPEEDDTAGADRTRRNGGSTRANTPAAPQSVWIGARLGHPFRPRMALPGRFIAGVYPENDRYGMPSQNQRRNNTSQNSSQAAPEISAQQNPTIGSGNSRSLARNPFRNMSLPFGRGRNTANGPPSNTSELQTSNPTPGQLEAGTVVV